MRVLGLDFETTGLDTEKARVIEAGWAIYDTELKQIMGCENHLLMDDTYPESDPDAVAIHGISDEVLNKYAKKPSLVFEKLLNDCQEVDFLCAHNGNNYDKPLMESELVRHEMAMPQIPWIDTRIDIDYPDDSTQRRLKYLAVDHGFYNPFPHRAVFDVVCMLRILSMYDFESVKKNALSPSIKIRAMVNFDKRHLAKERRYQWDGENKIWWKLIKEFRLEEEKQAPFNVVVLTQE